MYRVIRSRRPLALLAAALLGCATIPRPVPTGEQMAARVELQGVSLMVARIDLDAYPNRVLEVASPVYVLIDNGGESDLSISREDFSLGAGGGLQQVPLEPGRILVLREPPPADAAPGTPRRSTARVLLAGPVMDAPQPAPPENTLLATARTVPPPPPAYPRIRDARRRLRAGVLVYMDPFWYWGYPPYWGWGWGYPPVLGPLYAPQPRRSIIRMALHEGQLPKGARAAGFLYFPRLGGSTGTPLVLRWRIHDAPGRKPLGVVEVPLVLDHHP